jgi:prepilin-type N-terminal cleavage/methylation domain-containing protein
MRRLRLRDERGVTLIEMIMVLAILGIVLAGVTTVFIGGSRAELNVNNRFQAQEASRLALAAIRKDMHSACAAKVTSTTLMSLSIPIMDTSVSPAIAPVSITQCGNAIVASTKNVAKIIWCVLASPTVPTLKFAIYRQRVTTTVTTCTSSSTLIADNLIAAGGAGYFSTSLMAAPAASVGSINFGETQTVDVEIPVSLKQGTAGVLFDLKERLAVGNTVWAKTTTDAATGCTASVPCYPGPCNYKVAVTLTVACFPPAIL